MRDYDVHASCGCTVKFTSASEFRESTFSPCKKHRETKDPKLAKEREQIKAMARIHRDRNCSTPA